MLNPRWRKVGRDIWGNKVRTLLVVLSIAVGVFAVGLIAGTRAAMVEDMNGAFRASNPAHAVMSPSVATRRMTQPRGCSMMR